jgi:uncharacterized protein YndB with AHSA1/START domain
MIYEQSPEMVWAALTTSDAIAAWLMPNDFVAQIGHRFHFRTKPAPGFDGIVQCEVLEIIPLRKLVYSWVGGGVNTRVTWNLAAEGAGTRLTLDHTGFSGLRGLFVRGILGKGWRSKILRLNLPSVLSRWHGTGAVPATPQADCHRE